MKELENTSQSVPKGKRFCTICGEVKRVHYFEGDSTHCSACCEKMLHTRLNARYIPFVLVLLAVLAASVFLSVQTVSFCRGFLPAREAMRDKRLTDANELYADMISGASERNARLLVGGNPDDSGSIPAPTWTFFEPGARTWVRYLDTYAMVYSTYEASSVAQSSLDAETCARVRMIADLYKAKQAYEDTLAYASEVEAAHPFEGAENMPFDEIIGDLTAHADKSGSRFVKGYIEYYKGMAAKFYKSDDPSFSAAYFENMLRYLPNDYMTVYTAEADAAIQAQDYDAAIGAYEKILEKNRNETDAYLSVAEMAFLGGNDEKRTAALAHFDEDDPQRLRMEMRFALRGGKLDEAVNVRERAARTADVKAEEIFNKMLADQAIDTDNRTVLLNYLSYAVENAALALVQGDAKTAFTIAYGGAFNYAYYYAYLTNDSGAFSKPLINIATLCASLVKDQDALKAIREIGACDATTQDLIDGKLKMTMRELFVERKAEII